MDHLKYPENAPEKKNRFRKFSIIFLLIVFAGLLAYYFICGFTYSEGTRSGVLTKVSKRGFIFKTYEGEMNVGGLNQGDGTIMPMVVFKFSVRDEAVYDSLEKAQGHKIVLHYKEVLKSFFWQGDSDYFIYQVSSVH
jgi:hypothetical protein